MGGQIVEKIMESVQGGIKDIDEQAIAEMLKEKHADYLRLRKIRGEENEKEEETKKASPRTS
jgi:hypothetical protein